MRGHGAWWLDEGTSRYFLSNTNLSTIGWMYYKPIKVPLISIKTNTFNYANHTILREVETPGWPGCRFPRKPSAGQLPKIELGGNPATVYAKNG